MSMYPFGTGTLFAKRTDTANKPPMFFGVLQDLSIDFDQKLEPLFGQSKVAVAMGDGQLSIKGSAKFARFQQTLFSNFLTGVADATGMLEMVSTGESATIPSTPYQVTVANNASTPLADYGVFYQSTGVQLTPVASSPSTGQYAFNASTGVYTFNSADTGLAVWLYYSYTVATGKKTAMTNPLMGSSPTFEVFFKNASPRFGTAKDVVLKLNCCKSSKLSLPFSNQKFTIQNFDFEAFADDSDNVLTICSSE